MGMFQIHLKVYRGKDCVEVFIDHIEAEVKRLHSLVPEQPMIPLTEVIKREYEEASTCHICMKPFDDPDKKLEGSWSLPLHWIV